MIYEACIGVLGIQDICHFTSRDINKGEKNIKLRGRRIIKGHVSDNWK